MPNYDPRDKDEVDAARNSGRDAAGNPKGGRAAGNAGAGGLRAGYMSGNAYPGYRGPTGTRNPKARPEPSPTRGANFNPTDKPPASPSWMQRLFGPRYTPNPTPGYTMSVHNMAILGGMLPGPGMIAKAGAMIAGIGPQYEGYTGMKLGYDYDAKDRSDIPNVQTGLPDFASRFYNALPR